MPSPWIRTGTGIRSVIELWFRGEKGYSSMSALAETRRASHRPLIKRYQATTEGSQSTNPWNIPGYSGFVPHRQFTMGETHGGSMASAESSFAEKMEFKRSRTARSPPCKDPGFSESFTVARASYPASDFGTAAEFGEGLGTCSGSLALQRRGSSAAGARRWHVPGFTGYIPGGANISSRSFAHTSRVALNPESAEQELVRSSGELVMEPNRARPGQLPVRPYNIGKPTMSHPWYHV